MKTINYSIAYYLQSFFFVILHIVTVYKVVVHLQNSGEVVNLTTVLYRNDF